MSAGIICEGCGASTKGTPKEWLKVSVQNGHNTKIAAGDFCSENCLAKYLARDDLDRLWKQGAK